MKSNIFVYRMARMFENGLLERLRREWLHGHSTCSTPAVSKTHEVVLHDVLGAVCVAGVGAGLAIIVLVGERVVFLLHRTK